MKLFTYLFAVTLFFISCNKISDAEAKQIVAAYITYKNTYYDGAGVVKATSINITNITTQTDSTGLIDYTWSGEYKDAAKKENPSPTFLPVKDLSDKVMIVRQNNTWTFSHN